MVHIHVSLLNVLNVNLSSIQVHLGFLILKFFFDHGKQYNLDGVEFIKISLREQHENGMDDNF